MEKIRHDRKFWLALTIFSLMGQIAWVVENMYLNVFIYKMFNASAEDISTMVAASAVMATITTVLMGAFSDKIGKRKLFICGGYILWGISILGFCLLQKDIIGALFPTAASVSAEARRLSILFFSQRISTIALSFSEALPASSSPDRFPPLGDVRV